MLRRSILAAVLAVAAAGCHSGSPSSAVLTEGAVVRSGTSFGMCVGYCVAEMSVLPDEVVLVRTSRDPDRFPTRTDRLPLPASEYAEVAALLDAGDFRSLRESYGCPDCADGGAEWVEVEVDGAPRRVTFEYGHTLPEIAPLVGKLRQLRARFPEPPTGG